MGLLPGNTLLGIRGHSLFTVSGGMHLRYISTWERAIFGHQCRGQDSILTLIK